MTRKTAATAGIILALSALVLAQPVPLGRGEVRPVPKDKLVDVLTQEMEWLSGLKVEASGWDKALSALEGAVEELAATDTPTLELLAQVDAALDLVGDILERTAFQRGRTRLKESRQGPPEWLEGYLDEATSGMGAEEAARVRAIVTGLLAGIRAQAGQLARERIAGREPQGLQSAPGRGVMRFQRRAPASTREKLPLEVETWTRGYLAGATAGMGEEEAQKVREICRDAIRAGWEFGQERRAERHNNLEHFLRLRGLAAGLDLLILRQTSQ